MKKVLVTLLCLAGFAVTAQDSRQRFADLGDLKLSSGQTLRNCRVGYRTFGKPNGTNAILFPTWFSGTSQNLEGFLGGPGSMVDTTRYFAVLVDALGNSVSSSPSNSKAQPNEQFPHITIRDMVSSQHRLLTEKLRVTHLYAVMGISMGGMQTFEWMASYPSFVDKVIPIIGTPKLSAPDLYLWGAQLQAIESLKGSPEAMRTVALIHAMHLYTPAWRARQTAVSNTDEFIEKSEEANLKNNPFDWASQLRAMIHHDIYRSSGQSEDQLAKNIKPRALFIVATQDQMVTPFTAMALARKATIPLVEMTGDCGHMATSCERDKMMAAVSSFLVQKN